MPPKRNLTRAVDDRNKTEVKKARMILAPTSKPKQEGKTVATTKKIVRKVTKTSNLEQESDNPKIKRQLEEVDQNEEGCQKKDSHRSALEQICEDTPDEDSDMEDHQIENKKRNIGSLPAAQPSRSFLINAELDNPQPEKSFIELLEDAVKTKSLIRMGKVCREGFLKSALTELQLQEFARGMERPNIPVTQFIKENEEASHDEEKSIRVAMILLNSMMDYDHLRIKKIDASVRSLSSKVAGERAIGKIVKKHIGHQYVIRSVGRISQFNLTNFYNKSKLNGKDAISELTGFFTNVLKKLMVPNFAVWQMAYRPISGREVEKGFVELPPSVVDTMHDMAMEAVGLFLPDDLIGDDEVDPTHTFLSAAHGAVSVEEVYRRRENREIGIDNIRVAIIRSLKALRGEYHLDHTKEELVKCRQKNCLHTKWDQVRKFIEDENIDIGEITFTIVNGGNMAIDTNGESTEKDQSTTPVQ